MTFVHFNAHGIICLKTSVILGVKATLDTVEDRLKPEIDNALEAAKFVRFKFKMYLFLDRVAV